MFTPELPPNEPIWVSRSCPAECIREHERMKAALDSILCLIGESEPDFCSPYHLRQAIIKECWKGLGKEVAQ
jgi:hypothetical protein